MRALLCLALVFLPLLVGGGNMATITYEIVTADGVTFDLSTGVFKLYGLENIGMPGVRTYSHMVPGQPGAVLDDKLDEVRIVTVAQMARGADATAVFAAINDVAENYRYNRATTLQPLRLRVTVDGTAADLYCYYGGMIVNKLNNRYSLFGFNLEAYDPYWYATSETDTEMQCIDSLAVSYILGKVDNVWTAMGDNGTGSVLAIAIDSNDDLYIGCAGADWAGEGDADYIAFWDKSTTTWSALGTGADDDVNCLVIGPNGDLYAGGDFTGMGGVGATANIARWDGAAWNALGAGGPGGGGDSVDSMAFDSDGNLYVGGDFLNMGGVGAADMVAMWDGSVWTGLDVGLDDAVLWLAIDKSDNVYFVGVFTDVAGGGGGTYNRAIKWDGSAWSALGTGLNNTGTVVAIDVDGRVYIGGLFITADGVTVNRVAIWNGSTFEAMDGGTNNIVYTIVADPDRGVWVGGAFTEVGSSSMPVAMVARWNGASWRPVAFDPPGAASILAMAWDSDDNQYMGFNQAGEALVSKIVSVTHAGNVDVPPTTAINGPGTLVMIRNETTGVEMPFNLYINDGEAITVDLGNPGMIPGSIGISTDWTARPNANNLLGKSLSPAELGQFKLAGDPVAASGVNKVGIFVTGQPAEAGDGGNILSRWAGITGVDTTNTDAGRLYVSITVETDGDTAPKALFYDDSAKTSLVASAELSTTTTGSRAIVEENASGLGGYIYQDTALGLGAELVQNPGFETAGGGGADIWANWTEVASDGALANDVGTVHGGVDSNKTTAGATKDTLVHQAVVTTAAKIYEVSFWSYGDGTNAGRYVVYDESNAADIIALTSTGDTAAAWAQLGPIYVIAPVGCISMGIYLQCADLDTAVTYFDDVSIKEVQLAPDTDITADYAVAVISHWDRYDSLFAAVD